MTGLVIVLVCFVLGFVVARVHTRVVRRRRPPKVLLAAKVVNHQLQPDMNRRQRRELARRR